MSGAFWRFGNDYQSMSTINKLLDEVSDEAKELDYQPSVEVQDEILQSLIVDIEADNDIKILDQLLDQQDILQELLSSNTKLLDFLKNFKVLNRLVELVILDFDEYNKLKEKQLKRKKRLEQKKAEEGDKKQDPDAIVEENEEPDSEPVEDKKHPEDDSSSSSSSSSSSDSEGGAPLNKSESSWNDGDNSLSSFYDSNSYYNLNENNEEDDDDDESPQEIYSRRSQVAAEVLSTDIWSITDAFINYPRLLVKLWTILDSKQPLSMMKSNFFSKINEHLLDMKLEELISYIINFEKNLTSRFLNHINNPQLMDFLLKLISTDKTNNSTGIILMLKKQNFIPKLINFLKPKYDNAIQTSAGDFLKAFITISGNSASGQDGSGVTDSSIIGPNELTRQLVSKKMVKRLVKIMLCGGNSLSNGVGIVIEIIRKNNSDYDVFQVLLITLESHPPNLRDPIYLGNLVKIFAKNMKHFKQMLLFGSSQHSLKNHKKDKVETSFRKKIEPLGFERFKVCELVAELLHCSNMALLNEVTGESVVSERDAERKKVLKSEIQMFEESKKNYIEELKMNGDELLAQYIISDTNPIIQNVSLDDEETEDSHEIVHNINRLSISDDAKDGIKSIRSEHNKNKRANVNKLAKDGIIQSESDSEESVVEDAKPDDDEDEEEEEGEYDDSDDDSDESDVEQNDLSYDIDLSDEIHEDNEEQFEKALETKIVSDEFSFDFGNLIQTDSYRDEFNVEDRQYYDAEEKNIREKYIVGDQLKIALQDSNIIMIIIDFFFKFPWNNFLHNVVYDIIQQILNGSIEVGFNKYLIINLFLKQKGFILEKILRGYEFSEKYEKLNNGLRLGYMGHLTLISEEIVKFLSFSNLKSLFWEPVKGQENVEREYEFVNNGEEWNNYVNNILIDTREQFNSVLGGSNLNDDFEMAEQSTDSVGDNEMSLSDGSDNEDIQTSNDEGDVNDEEHPNDDDDDDDDDDGSKGNDYLENDFYDIKHHERTEDNKEDKINNLLNGMDNPEGYTGNNDQYKWHYLDKSDYHHDDTESNEDHDDEDDEYIDPNDDGNNYANPNEKNIYLYSSLISRKNSSDANDKSSHDSVDEELDLEADDDPNEDDDDDDLDIDEDEENYGLSRSKSKGDMNWNEDEQKRLLTMANFIHNNTGGSAVSAINSSEHKGDKK